MVDPYYDEDHPVIAELTKRVAELEEENAILKAKIDILLINFVED